MQKPLFLLVAMALATASTAVADRSAAPRVDRAAVDARLAKIAQSAKTRAVVQRLGKMNSRFAVVVHKHGDRALLLTKDGFQVAKSTMPLSRLRSDESYTWYTRYRVPLFQWFLRGKVLDSIESTEGIEATIDRLSGMSSWEPLRSTNGSAAEEKINPWGYERMSGAIASPLVLRSQFLQVPYIPALSTDPPAPTDSGGGD